MRANPHQVVQDTRDLVEHGADVERAFRRLNAEQFLDRQYIAMLVAHHGDVIEAVHVADTLVVWLVLCELLRTTVKQSDMRVGALDDLAIHFKHETQNAVRGRMLRAEIDSVVTNLGHQLAASSSSDSGSSGFQPSS